MNKKNLALSIALLSIISTPLLAEGKASAGKGKVASCAGCHGEKGNSMMPLFPKLAAQHPNYLVKQLQAYKDGSRTDATMAPMAMGLSDSDMADIAAFYAEQKISKNDLPVLNNDDDDDDEEDEDNEEESGNDEQSPDINELLKIGSDLYRNGNLETKVSACVACHGPYGEGNKPAAFPALKSQHADYLIKSLTDYKSGARGQEDSMMSMIAKKMTEEEIRAVSYHISMKK
jgi:cytochrome c553